MGEVYLAWDTRLSRKVALKRLAPALHDNEEHRRRFLQEAERAASLSHQNVASMHDVVEHAGEIFLVMEFVDGRPFDDFTKDRTSTPEFLDLAIQITEALQAAHDHNIVHRDVKPSNIRVTETGQIKILDFGVARRIPRSLDDSQTSTVDTTSRGSIVGTPAYMAPEILIGIGADERSDLFSLGIVFYQALTGRHPFMSDTFATTVGRILNEAPTPVGELNSRVPMDLERIVEKLLAKNRDRRYATAADLLVDLCRVRAHFTPRTPRSTPATWRRHSWKRGIGYAVLALLFVAIVVLAIPATRELLSERIRPSPLPAMKHVAVLPFEAPGENMDHAALARGLSDRLTVDLARLTVGHSDLLVARPSQVASRGVSNLQEGEEELGTTLILKGSLEDLDSEYRLHVLVQGNGRLHREVTVDGPADDPFVLHERLLEAVVNILEVDWTESERRASRQAFETHDPTACSFLLRGQGYLQNLENESSLEMAITQFDSALRLEPDCAAAMAGFGLAHWRLGDLLGGEAHPDLAIDSCEEALRLDDRAAAGNVCLAEIFVGLDRLEEGAVHLERAHLLDPTNDEVLRDVQSVLLALGRFPEVESLLVNAVARRPNDWRPLYDLAYLYSVDLGRNDDAATVLEEAARLAPQNYRVHSFLGAEYAALMRYADAARALETSISIRESNVDAHNNLATAYFFQRNWPAAAEHYGRAIDLGYDLPTIWGNLGDARYWSPGERDQAGYAFERALQLAEESTETPDGDLTAKMAVWSAMLGRAEEATDLSKRAVEMAPQNPIVLMKAARVHDQLGDPASALAWIERALAAGYRIDHLLADPIFDNLRTHPDFERILSSR